ncbi:MAG: FmdB family zinc ribbon protein [Chloroflexota bacterium]
MPLYEYHCNDCAKEFEKMVRFSEANQNPPCPACEGRDTRKKISSFASLGGAQSVGAVSSGSSCGSSGAFR